MGYFLVMIIFMSIGVATAKKSYSWIWYGIGVALQAFSMYGTYSHYQAMGFGVDFTEVIVVFLVLAAAFAGAIVYRQSGNKKDKASDKAAESDEVSEYSEQDSGEMIRPAIFDSKTSVDQQERVLVPEIDEAFYEEKTVASFEEMTVADDKTLPLFVPNKPKFKAVFTRLSDGHRIECKSDFFSVGKSDKTSNIKISDNQKISRTHALFSKEDGSYYVTDNSSNGTYINDVKLPKDEKKPIKDGDRIRFADEDFIFNIEEY